MKEWNQTRTTNTSKNSRICQALLRRQAGLTRPVSVRFWNFETTEGVLNWPYSTHSELTSDLMLWIYSGFISLILFLLALDLGVFHRKAHVISVREALGWSAFWIFLGVSFSIFIYFGYENHWLGLGLTPDMMGSAPKMVEGLGTVYNDGASATMKYLTGYLVEKSLSVDNIFVISMIFAFLAVPQMYQHRVLFWGIVGALPCVSCESLSGCNDSTVLMIITCFGAFSF